MITLGGKPVKIPKLGMYLRSSNSQYLAITLVVIGGIMLGTGNKVKRKKRRRGKVIDTGTLYLMLSALLAFGIVFAGSTLWGEISVTYVSTLGGGQREGWYLPGSVVEENVTIKNYARIPMVFIVKGKIVNDTIFKLGGGEERVIKGIIHVPEETRVYTERVNVYSYYPLLPTGTIERAYSINPYLPLIIEGLLVFLALAMIKPFLGEPEYISLGRFWK